MRERPLLIVGLDPGIGLSHAVALDFRSNIQPYRVQAHLELHTPPTPAPLPHPADWNLSALVALQPDAVLIEVARGAVASGRDADPVLHVNLIAGELIGRLNALGVLAVSVASGGDAAGWNWRSEIGVRGKGASVRDECVEQVVAVHLGKDALPIGPRGGKITHWQDAAGIALAGLSRIRAHYSLDVRQALTTFTVRDEVTLAARKSRKTAQKAARSGKRVWL